MTLYFNAASLPEARYEYVAWVDVMGIQESMSRSLNVSANFMCKLHIAVLQVPNLRSIKVYPVMDGFYATSETKQSIEQFLRSLFGSIAEEFTLETEQRHKFIVKGALAFGPVIHGANIPSETSREIATNSQYARTLLLGMPMVQANGSEKFAPPFGIYVHESARSFSPSGERPFRTTWWTWENEEEPIWRNLRDALTDYYDWCAERAGAIGYDPERLCVHRRMMEHYFVNATSEQDAEE